jgi:hypothetical protein
MSTTSEFFAQYGFGIVTNGTNVVVIGLSGLPSGTSAPPNGMITFVCFEMTGELTPGGYVAAIYLYYNRTRVSELGLNESTLALYTWNPTLSEWDTVPVTRSTINATCGLLTAYVTHFSYFAVFGSPPSSGRGIELMTILMIVATLAVILVIIAALVYLKKKAKSEIRI